MPIDPNHTIETMDSILNRVEQIDATGHWSSRIEDISSEEFSSPEFERFNNLNGWEVSFTHAYSIGEHIQRVKVHLRNTTKD